MLLVVVGCGTQSAFTDEMRQQETEMSTEVSDWQSQLAQWDTDHQEMHAWHSAHPLPAGSDLADELVNHEQKMTDHERKVGEFKTELATHQQKLQEEMAKPEKDRTMAHAALWAEHMRLKTSFAMLRGEHESVGQEHAEFTSKASGTTPPRSD
jgi:hypothetical protein